MQHKGRWRVKMKTSVVELTTDETLGKLLRDGVERIWAFLST